MSDEKLLLTATETAKLLSISRTAVYQLVRRDDFPKMYVGRKVLIAREELVKWVKDNTANHAEVAL